jgi:hypothetical protein
MAASTCLSRRMFRPMGTQSTSPARRCVSFVLPSGWVSRKCTSVSHTPTKNYGRAHSLRLAGRHGHAGLLRSGGSKPLVHFGLRGSVRPRLDLRFPAGRMAIRDHRSYMGWRSDVALVAEVTDLIADSTITCPKCGHRASEQMPMDACRFFYDCRACGERLQPLPGDCCVFCSYGSLPCPSIQAGRSCHQP